MKKNMMIAVDFDRKSVRYRKNGLGRKVGEFAIMNDGARMMVYCLLEVDEEQDEVIHSLFRRGFQQNENFCDRLNGAVEEILDAISEKKMNVYRSRKQEMQRRQERLNDALLAALVPGWKF